jgi:hypothetical protein
VTEPAAGRSKAAHTAASAAFAVICSEMFAFCAAPPDPLAITNNGMVL